MVHMAIALDVSCFVAPTQLAMDDAVSPRDQYYDRRPSSSWSSFLILVGALWLCQVCDRPRYER